MVEGAGTGNQKGCITRFGSALFLRTCHLLLLFQFVTHLAQETRVVP